MCDTGPYLEEPNWSGCVKGGVFLQKEVSDKQLKGHAVMTYDLWHGRLGHASRQVISLLAKNLDMVNKLSNKVDEPCDICFHAKQTRCSFSESDTKASDCLLYTSPSPRDGLLSRMPSSA